LARGNGSAVSVGRPSPHLGLHDKRRAGRNRRTARAPQQPSAVRNLINETLLLRLGVDLDPIIEPVDEPEHQAGVLTVGPQRDRAGQVRVLVVYVVDQQHRAVAAVRRAGHADYARATEGSRCSRPGAVTAAAVEVGDLPAVIAGIGKVVVDPEPRRLASHGAAGQLVGGVVGSGFVGVDARVLAVKCRDVAEDVHRVHELLRGGPLAD